MNTDQMVVTPPKLESPKMLRNTNAALTKRYGTSCLRNFTTLGASQRAMSSAVGR